MAFNVPAISSMFPSSLAALIFLPSFLEESGNSENKYFGSFRPLIHDREKIGVRKIGFSDGKRK